MGAARQLWQAWRRAARAIGRFNTLVILTVIYIVVVPLFALWRLRDPLGLRLLPRDRADADDGQSYWRDRPRVDQTPDLERHTHQY
jgi:hypothetical protein